METLNYTRQIPVQWDVDVAVIGGGIAGVCAAAAAARSGVRVALVERLARDGRNLLMAGRNLSADRQAQSSVRVATSGAMMGQAVGIAAAMAAQKDTDVRALNPDDIRRVILARGAVLDV